jgi:hypothetical protein
MNDPLCRCSRGKISHVDGTGACMISEARCHEFVLKLDDPPPLTEHLLGIATNAVILELQVHDDIAARAAFAALTAARDAGIERDRELDRVRRDRDRLREQVAELTKIKETEAA